MEQPQDTKNPADGQSLLTAGLGVLIDFHSKEDAEEWMVSKVDDQCIDNYRFAFLDDEGALSKYAADQNDGCCGFYDAEITINGRIATIGCNYGH